MAMESSCAPDRFGTVGENVLAARRYTERDLGLRNPAATHRAVSSEGAGGERGADHQAGWALQMCQFWCRPPTEGNPRNKRP